MSRDRRVAAVARGPLLPGGEGGFTLIEVLVAFTILLIGMVGIMGLFTTALSLQSEAALRQDVARVLPAVLAQIEEDLAASRSAGTKPPGEDSVFPVPGFERYRYRVRTEPIPGDAEGRGVFARVEILSRQKGETQVFDFGWMTVVPEPDNDSLIERLSTER